jgi:hypothetical protein
MMRLAQPSTERLASRATLHSLPTLELATRRRLMGVGLQKEGHRGTTGCFPSPLSKTSRNEREVGEPPDGLESPPMLFVSPYGAEWFGKKGQGRGECRHGEATGTGMATRPRDEPDVRLWRGKAPGAGGGPLLKS